MKNKESVEVRSPLWSEDRSGQYKVGMLGAFSRALKLQMLMDENLYLEQRLVAMVLNNRALQSMRSRKPSFKF